MSNTTTTIENTYLTNYIGGSIVIAFLVCVVLIIVCGVVIASKCWKRKRRPFHNVDIREKISIRSSSATDKEEFSSVHHDANDDDIEIAESEIENKTLPSTKKQLIIGKKESKLEESVFTLEPTKDPELIIEAMHSPDDEEELN